MCYVDILFQIPLYAQAALVLDRGIIFQTKQSLIVNFSVFLAYRVNLTANYIKLLCQRKEVYQYHVDFSPTLDNKRLKISLLAEHKSLLKSIQGFDGSILYLPFQLPNKVWEESVSFTFDFGNLDSLVFVYHLA